MPNVANFSKPFNAVLMVVKADGKTAVVHFNYFTTAKNGMIYNSA